MRFSFVLYAVLYVVAEIVGHQLSQVDWSQLTLLMVATAVTDALLLVAIAAAVFVAADTTRPRWQPALAGWAQTRLARRDRDPEASPVEGAPLDVRSWRAEPLALPAGRPAAPPVSYGPSPGGVRPFPDEPGLLL